MCRRDLSCIDWNPAVIARGGTLDLRAEMDLANSLSERSRGISFQTTDTQGSKTGSSKYKVADMWSGSSKFSLEQASCVTQLVMNIDLWSSSLAQGHWSDEAQ
ncbi:hypothetical protein PGTUg99_014745 [Puccinia graminis f. sp. tritici]|uniref:Uncharacterized protein n=1 Tax=Puccinia graminis f. sp. tritici TaxID=56615 RepID=A0A5B0RQY0_PUCGR|nr:hypothetical protein PGTUg99_014745 [Puccinia graminis f. sp. tritici]